MLAALSRGLDELVDVGELRQPERGTLTLSSRIERETTSTMSRLLAPRSLHRAGRIDVRLFQAVDGVHQVLADNLQNVFSVHGDVSFFRGLFGVWLQIQRVARSL